MEKISYVIPCYRSEHTISIVVDQIREVMAVHTDYDYEVIMVSDNSPDNVWEVISQMAAKDSHLRGIRLVRNFGEHGALMAGYNHITGDYVVSIDDDGQTPVDQTFILLDKLKEGYDVVYGRYAKRRDNIFRKFGTFLNNKMSQSLLGKPKKLQLTSFYIARAMIIKEICNYKNAFPYTWGLILRTTKNVTNAVIEHKERLEGESGYTLGKLLSLWMNGFTAFSIKPLRFSAGIGVLFSLLGFGGIIYTIVDKILHPLTAAGYASLMCVILVVGGLLLLSMGLIGEYIGRIYLCINATPQFIIRDSINIASAEEKK